MARGDTLHPKILGGITSKFENFGSEVFKNSGEIDGG